MQRGISPSVMKLIKTTVPMSWLHSYHSTGGKKQEASWSIPA